MLTIRFARTGKKNRAQFQIVLQEHTATPKGKHIEVLGGYDPHQKKAVLKEDRIKYWVEQGAQMSDTAYNLFVSKGVISGEKRKVKLSKKVEVEAKTEAPKTEVKEVKTEEIEPAKEEAVKEEVKKEENPEVEVVAEEKKEPEVVA